MKRVRKTKEKVERKRHSTFGRWVGSSAMAVLLFTGLATAPARAEGVPGVAAANIATATSPYGLGARYNAAPGAIVKAAPSKKSLQAAKPTITGTKKVGYKLTAKPGKWTSKTKFKYQWYRNGKAIKGATSKTYTLKSADAGKRMTVKVTGSKSGYCSKAKLSGKTAVVAKGTMKLGTPVIKGVKTIGATLGVERFEIKVLPTSANAPKLKYQWYRENNPIQKATSSTYTLKSADVGKSIKVKTTLTLPGYKTVSKTSTSTTKVRNIELTKVQMKAAERAEFYAVHGDGFSESGLITHVAWETGYSTKDVTVAVDCVAPDWNGQAAKKAKLVYRLWPTKEDVRQQLEGAGFTAKQVAYGLESVGF